MATLRFFALTLGRQPAFALPTPDTSVPSCELVLSLLP